jgi:hypothetical protein
MYIRRSEAEMDRVLYAVRFDYNLFRRANETVGRDGKNPTDPKKFVVIGKTFLSNHETPPVGMVGNGVLRPVINEVSLPSRDEI